MASHQAGSVPFFPRPVASSPQYNSGVDPVPAAQHFLCWAPLPLSQGGLKPLGREVPGAGVIPEGQSGESAFQMVRVGPERAQTPLGHV